MATSVLWAPSVLTAITGPVNARQVTAAPLGVAHHVAGGGWRVAGASRGERGAARSAAPGQPRSERRWPGSADRGRPPGGGFESGPGSLSSEQRFV